MFFYVTGFDIVGWDHLFSVTLKLNSNFKKGLMQNTVMVLAPVMVLANCSAEHPHAVCLMVLC